MLTEVHDRTHRLRLVGVLQRAIADAQRRRAGIGHSALATELAVVTECDATIAEARAKLAELNGHA